MRYGNRQIIYRQNRQVVNKIYSALDHEGDESKILSFPFLNRIIQNSYIDPNFKWYSSIDETIDQKIFQIVAKDQDTRQGVKELRAGLDEKLLEFR